MSLPTAESGSLVPTGHPRAFWFIFWGEFAERCSFYGMRAILLLYLTQVLGFSDRAGSSILDRTDKASPVPRHTSHSSLNRVMPATAGPHPIALCPAGLVFDF